MGFVYELPDTTGGAAPTPTQSARISEVAGVYTGNGESASFTITHSLEIPTEDLTNGLPEVEFEPLDAAFYTELPVIASKTENTVVINIAGHSSAPFVRVRVKRPNTLAL